MAKSSAILPLAIITPDPSSSVPLYRQLYEKIRDAILTKQIKAGSRLPSTRELSNDLGISRNTVINAFEQLLAEGYIEGKIGAGTYVAKLLTDELLKIHTKLSQTLRIDTAPVLSQQGAVFKAIRGTMLRNQHERPRAFRPGVPALNAFPIKVWTRLVSRHWQQSPHELLGYGDPAGYRPLRELIADHLKSTRALHCQAEQIIIVSGTQQALDLAVRVLLNPGDTTWIEDPGYLGIRAVLLSANAHIVPVPVDSEGLNVTEGISRNSNARLVCVSPSHQYPLGVTMSLARRLALLEWASRSGAWVLEDDYDSEYRYAGRPLAALQGLDNDERVIYIGTFSKVLFPSLRLGYMVVPPKLVDTFTAARAITDRHSPLLEQAVLADFIDEGHFTRHIRNMRMLYAERQEALIQAAQDLAEFLDVQPASTGLHLMGWLSSGLDEQVVSQYAAEVDVEVQPLSMYSIETFPSQGLLLGYAAVDLHQIREGIHRLRSAMYTAKKACL